MHFLNLSPHAEKGERRKSLSVYGEGQTYEKNPLQTAR
jgi:hypothetical protein